MFRVTTNLYLNGLEIAVIINFPTNFTSYLTFIAANMFFPKQELPIEITDLNIVIISTEHASVRSRTKAHECKHLDKLAAECTSAN